MVERQRRPHEDRIGDDLRHQKGREGDPRNADGQGRDDVREADALRDPACEQEGRNGRRAHHKTVEDVRVVETGRDEVAAKEGREQERVELVDVPDQLTVDVWKR